MIYYHSLKEETMLRSFMIISLLVGAIKAAKVSDEFEAQDFLIRYGYISNNSVTDFESALIGFQERYNLLVDGQLNKETLELMNRPRCAEGEEGFTVRSKWNKTELRWYFPQALRYDKVHDIAKKAFSFWENNSNLKFVDITRPKPTKPDITISVQRMEHWFRANCQGREKCPFKFDGRGTVLAHAYHPQDNLCREIHIDEDESWYYGIDGNAPNGQSSLLNTLIHEIGHALGLGHSDVPSSVMYPWYQQKLITFSSDDKMALEYLYGAKEPVLSTDSISPTESIKKQITTTIPTSKSVPTSTISSSNKSTSLPFTPSKNLCEIPFPDIIFLANAPDFPNYRLYVIHRNFLWKLDLKDKKIPREAEDLRTYLPNGLSKIKHVFQNTLGNLFVVSDAGFQSVAFPNLNIQQDIIINLPDKANINAAFQTNAGKTYIFFNNKSFIEFNENDSQILNRGRIKDMFPGIPENVVSAFQYIDGHLYFFHQDVYYKYNEFTRTLVEAGTFNWNIFNISCPNESLLNKLKHLLSKIIDLYN